MTDGPISWTRPADLGGAFFAQIGKKWCQLAPIKQAKIGAIGKIIYIHITKN